ncbi:hypothetical protein [Pseudomonas sp. NPDC087029]|uniref:hypothetical protein n=1 Tax=Pseudomonas sp. NPDC087029 TaxID=3364433 RepID=UPI0038164D66
MMQCLSELEASYPGLGAFLNDEVNGIAADLLLEQARHVQAGRPGVDYTGNAYHVAFSDKAVVLEHLHLPNHPTVTLGLDTFISVLCAWRTGRVM